MSDELDLGADTYEAGVELWRAHDCPECGSQNAVSDSITNENIHCHECETTFSIVLRPE